MVNITLSIPEDLKKEMEKFPEINWSVIARISIAKRLELLNKFKEFTRDSKITEEDALRLGAEVNRSSSKKLKEVKYR